MSDLPITPKTIITAFDRPNTDFPNFADFSEISETGTLGNINLSHIGTQLIKDCGRFAERHASDLFINWDTIRDFTTNPLPELRSKFNELEDNYSIIFCFGIRAAGVDGNDFLMSRLKNTESSSGYLHPEKIYRRILAVKITIYKKEPECQNQDIKVTLKNITNNFTKLHPDDKDSQEFQYGY